MVCGICFLIGGGWKNGLRNNEIIKIDSYDPETNTITFKTKSFSNYAIATRDTEAAVPDTGVMTSGDSSAVVALAGVMVSFVLVVTLFAAFKRSHRR